MDAATHLDHLRRDAAGLLAAYRDGPGVGVPSCPGWDRAALLAHTAGVHAWVRAQLDLGPGERVRLSTVVGPPDEGLAEWYDAGAAALVARLEAMDLAATWPTWAGPQPGTFFPRRMAQETAVHRWDADGTPLDPALAVDGIDEHLELMAPRIPAERFDGVAGTIHLHATDADGEWLVTVGADGIAFEHGHAMGDVALRGTASDLLLWVWGRQQPDDRYEVFGDPALLCVWEEHVRI
jgi:uncharacterized protein (TIGR03083 family)